MPNLIKYRYKNFKTQKAGIELKRRKLRILRELGKTLIKIKAIKMDKKLNNK
jgi:hypothetical protein